VESFKTDETVMTNCETVFTKGFSIDACILVSLVALETDTAESCFCIKIESGASFGRNCACDGIVVEDVSGTNSLGFGSRRHQRR
jgi:hypothetical protein